MAEVREPSYQGCDTTHPRIKEAMENAAKRGISKEEIQKRVGMPYEVVDNAVRKARKKK